MDKLNYEITSERTNARFWRRKNIEAVMKCNDLDEKYTKALLHIRDVEWKLGVALREIESYQTTGGPYVSK